MSSDRPQPLLSQYKFDAGRAGGGGEGGSEGGGDEGGGGEGGGGKGGGGGGEGFSTGTRWRSTV